MCNINFLLIKDLSNLSNIVSIDHFKIENRYVLNKLKHQIFLECTRHSVVNKCRK